MKSSEGFVRMRTLQGVVLFIFLLIAGRLAYIQLVDSKYNELAKANVLRHVVQYPPRGEVFDRNGEYLVQSRECYDLMVIYSEIDKHGFDTLRMCDVLGLSRGKLEKELANARMRPRAPRVVTNYISKEDKLRFDERDGYVPDRGWYDRQYRGSWNSLTVISLAIGQDALGCTPLQLANLAAIVANRGYYYIPHIVKKVEGRDSLDRRFYERHYTKVDPKHFEPIVEGMWRGVNVGGTSMLARLEGLDVCGKTGTAENPRGRDHSTFLSFAPKDNPKIAISVYVENGGFGASAALPIASLLEEYYLTDTIRRPALLDYVRNMTINYPAYDR